MSKIIIPAATAEVGGTLFDLVYNGSILNSEVANTLENGNRIIDDTNASAGQKLVITEEGILEILAEGGDIENYLFAIRQPSASASLKVPEGVPLREFILWNLNPVDANIKNFGQWYSLNADVWLNEVIDEIIYYNNPNPSGGPILKASEAEIIRQIDTDNNSFLTVAEAQAITSPGGVPDPNWVKL